MKAPTHASNFVVLAVIAVALFMTTACQSNSGGGNVAARNRNNGNNPTIVKPNGQVVTNPVWGVIDNFSKSGAFDPNVLQVFMYGATGLGSVSGNAQDNSGTGILFSGAIDQMNGTGTIGIMVKDSFTASNGQAPYYWTLNVVSVNGNGNTAVVMAADGDGWVTFDGGWTTYNGTTMWEGTVRYEMSPKAGGQSGDLGTFQIPACGIFSC